MIYIDSSVVLARLLSEHRNAPVSLWRQHLISSRLLEYEVWNRVHAQQLSHRLGGRTQQLIDLIQFTEMTPAVLVRALEPFPVGLRTLDTLHLASMDHLRKLGQEITLASFDRRLIAAARALHIPSYDF